MATNAPRYATFNRRLSAMIIDSLVLIVFSTVVFLLVPLVDSNDVLRIGLWATWFGGILFYEPIMVAVSGSTVGHRALNLRVVDTQTGENPGLGKAVARYLIKGVLGAFSFFSMAFTQRHQAVHDFMTSTTVQPRDLSKAKPSHYVYGRGPSPKGAV